MRELVTLHVMHLMPSSFVNNIFAGISCFGTKRIKMYLTKSADKRMIRFSLYIYYLPLILSFYENDSAVLTEKRFFFHDFNVCRCLFQLSSIARLYEKTNKVLQRCRVLAFYRIALCLNTAIAAIVLVSTYVRA